MKPTLLYRIASGLFGFFSATRTYGLVVNLRGRIVVPAAVISGGTNESIYVLSNRCCSSAAF